MAERRSSFRLFIWGGFGWVFDCCCSGYVFIGWLDEKRLLITYKKVVFLEIEAYSLDMSHAQTIAKNAAWLMLATAGQKLVAFVSFFVVARLNGADVTGRYFYAVAITSVFVILTDLGLTPVVIREMAADEKRGMAVLAKAVRAKTFLIPLAIFATGLYALLSVLASGVQAVFAPLNQEIFIAVAIACGVMSADAVSLLAYGALRGLRKLSFEAVGMFVSQIVTAVGAISVSLLLPHNVYALIVALLCGSLWNVGWSTWQLRRLDLSLDTPIVVPWRELMRLALPFALAGIFVKVYSYVDTLMLKEFRTTLEIGQYAVAYKITYAFQFLPLTFVAALYPGLSSAHAAKDHDALRRVFQGSLRLMMLTSIPVAVCLAVFSRWVPWLYGPSFVGSVKPLSILSWVLIPIFLDFPIGSLLNATRRAGWKTFSMGVAMVVNAVANLCLVPVLGAVGAAWSGLLSFSLLCLLGFWFVRRDIDGSWFGRFILQGAGAALCLWFIAGWSLRFLPPFAVALTVISGLGILFLFRLWTFQDVLLVKGWLKKRA